MPIRAVQVTPSLLHLDSIVTRLTGTQALAEACRYLRHEVSHYRWVGIYLVDGDALRLAAWAGPQATEHVVIPLGKGVCGRAAREGRTVIVNDVRESPEYLACFLETRSEIVVPIRGDATVLGEIDIDGNEVKAFDASDDRFLRAVATKLAVPARAASSAVAAHEPPARGGG